MIKDIVNDLKDMEIRYKSSLLLCKNKEIIIAYLIYLKYLCDKGEYNYNEVINNDKLYDITYDITRLALNLNRERLPINSIISKFKNINIKDLLLEYLSTLERQIQFHNDDNKLLYIIPVHNMYHFYNDKGNATYVTNRYNNKDFGIFRAFDDILGINNTYVDITDLDARDYDYVYVYDNLPKYLALRIHDTIYQDIYNYIRRNKNVVLYTRYSKVSNFSNGKMLVNYINTIIMDNNKVIMIFQGISSKEISIINYDNINDIDKLYSIIKNNRKQKDVLVKTTSNELRNNNLRIGFNLYQLEKDSEIRDINKIVDENTNYLNELNRINIRVEDEINKLLNR